MAGFEGGRTSNDPAVLADRLAEEFRLSQADMAKARAALEPAFELGLRQAMESPARWARLAESFMAMTPRAEGASRPAGETFLDTIFGAGALREAVSRQAATMTGISQEAIARLMPQFAAIGMESMMRGAFAHWTRHQPAGLASGDFGAATAEMMRRGANAVEALTRPSDTGRIPSMTSPADFFTQSFGQAFQTSLDLWTRGALATGRERVSAPSRPESGMDPMTPFAMMFGAFAKGMQAAADATPAPKTGDAPAENGASRPVTSLPPADPFGQFMRSGQKLHEDYTRGMTAVFERFTEPSQSTD